MGGGEVHAVVSQSALAERWSRIDPSVPKPRLIFSFLVCTMTAVAGFAFGYDLGVIASIFNMDSFKAKFPYTAWDKSWIVSFFLLGCTVGSLFQGWFADRVGRKMSIFYGSILFTTGGLIQSFSENIPMLFVGRVVAGLAVGMFSSIVPVYMAESVIYTFRGRMVTFQQLMIVFGISSAYWIDYATYKLVVGDWQWRAPLFVQAILGAIIFFGVIILPRSPRWLISKGREEDALKSLAKLRMLPADNEYVVSEFEDMKESYALELQIGQSTYRELLGPQIRRRFLIGCAVNAYQQLSGNNGVNYYAPDFYKQLNIGTTDTVLLLQGFYGLLKLVMTFPTFWIVDRFGRRPLLMVGGTIMSFAMIALGALFAATTGGVKGNVAILAKNPSLGIFGVALIWTFVIGYNASWGPITWVYSSEIFPLRARAKAVSLTSAVQWFCNFLIGLIIPPAADANTYAIFFALGAVALSSIPFVFFFVPETKGKTLEEMEVLFGVIPSSSGIDAIAIEAAELKESK